MALLFAFLKALGSYLVLMLIGINLIGIIVRGFIASPKEDPYGNPIGENISSPGSIALTLIVSLIAIAYLYALYHFINIYVLIAAIMIMLSRIPDLLYEIKTGKKINLKEMPKRPIDTIFNIIGWLALPVLCYAFYIF